MGRRSVMVGIAATALLAAAVACIDWEETARLCLARGIARATGRPANIEKLVFALGAPLRVRLTGLTIDNPLWARRPHMLELQAASFSLRLLPLLFGRLAFGDVTLTSLVVDLEQRKGRRSWEFDEASPAGEMVLPIVGADAVRLVDATLRYTVDEDRTDLILHAISKPGEPNQLRVEARGMYKAERLHVHAQSAAVVRVCDDAPPLPVRVDASLGATQARFAGTIGKVDEFEQVQGELVVEGASLADLRRVLRVRLPETPPYRLHARLIRDAGDWRLENLAGRLGARQVAGGRASYDPDAQPPVLHTQVEGLADLPDMTRMSVTGAVAPADAAQASGALELDVRDTISGQGG